MYTFQNYNHGNIGARIIGSKIGESQLTLFLNSLEGKNSIYVSALCSLFI